MDPHRNESLEMSQFLVVYCIDNHKSLRRWFKHYFLIGSRQANDLAFEKLCEASFYTWIELVWPHFIWKDLTACRKRFPSFLVQNLTSGHLELFFIKLTFKPRYFSCLTSFADKIGFYTELFKRVATRQISPLHQYSTEHNPMWNPAE